MYEITYNDEELKIIEEEICSIERENNYNKYSRLATLGLECYIDYELLEDNFFSMQLIFNKEVRKINHLNGDMSFFSDQWVIFNNLLKSSEKVISISTPTSFGKTTIVIEYLHRNNFKNIAYIVPTNSLAHELEGKFLDIFRDYEIFDSEKAVYDDNENTYDHERHLLFIGTQEKFVELKNFVPDIIVIDEAYKLFYEGQKDEYDIRKIILNSIFIKYLSSNEFSNVKIILLSPFVNINSDYINKKIYTNFNPIFQRITEYRGKDKGEYIANMIDMFKDSTHKSILYCKTLRNLREYAKSLISNDKNAPIDELIEYIKNNITDKEYYLVELLKKGYLVHTGKMPKILQYKMLDLFNDSNNNYNMIATSSISEGINTPTKNIFIDPEAPVGKNLEKLLLKNTIGRAGRLGVYKIGEIYMTSEQSNGLENLDKESFQLCCDTKDMKKDFEDESRLLDVELEDTSKKMILNFIDETSKHAFTTKELSNLINLLFVETDFGNKLNNNNVKKLLKQIYGSQKDVHNITFILFNEDLNSAIDKFVKYKKENGEKYDLQEEIDQMIDLYFQTIPFKIYPIVVFVQKIDENEQIKSLIKNKNAYGFIKDIGDYIGKNIYKLDGLTDDEKKLKIRLIELGMPKKELPPNVIQYLNSILPNRYSYNTIKEKVLKDQTKKLRAIRNYFGG